MQRHLALKHGKTQAHLSSTEIQLHLEEWGRKYQTYDQLAIEAPFNVSKETFLKAQDVAESECFNIYNTMRVMVEQIFFQKALYILTGPHGELCKH